MKKYIFNILTALLLWGLTACESQEDVASSLVPLRIKAEMVNEGFTRANDVFTDKVFHNDDEAGFFTEGGGSNGNKFENKKMIFKDGYFESPDNDYGDINRMGRTLMYYPYSTEENGRQPIRRADGPFKDEAIDFLYSTTVGNIDQGALVATFHHTFSMFAIDGGLGFENLKTENPEITVTMAKPLEYIEFQRVDDPTAEIGYKVVFDSQGTPTDATLADFKGHWGKQEDGEDVDKYYVMLPWDDVTTVKSINVKDDEGRMHHIPWSYTSEDGSWTSTGLEYGKKFSFSVALDEMVPVINLHNITPWGENNELDVTQKYGIGSASAFKNWMQAYNSQNPSDSELEKYGNKVEITNTITGEVSHYWHFILTSDIDLSGESFDTSAYLIDKLTDILDGGGHTLSGITRTGDNAALINIIDGEHASLENLKIDGLNITTSGTTSSVGGVTTTFKSGTIKNCTINNLNIEAASAAGAIAGSFGTDDAKVENCSVQGTIFATETVNKIAGSGSVSDEIKKECEVSNVMFGRK